MGMLGCKPASTPMDFNMKISAESGDFLFDASQYQRLVGRLIYLTNTHPDLAFAVGLSYFSNVDYAGSKTDWCSTSGFCNFYRDHLISWKSKKQPVVLISSVEASYHAMAQGTCEILWL
ncbi:uncharacterized mitochondrial protein AtMg00810-like [Cornus florida]|uniref:uncharacterized mitochondrial protein AtMg00810-like n=1 Tax=Cornus florida TaxID=4283 RepID=UPI0028A07993|nr:uncharacterized mitochondrial protein AtMg00810-like [Cornus florida]